MRSAAYVRVSSEEQSREGLSLRAQADQAERYCGLYGMELAVVVWDEKSAKDTNRPGFQLLMQMAKQRQVDAVVIWRLDRLFRNVEDAIRISRQIDRLGVALHSVSEQLDTKSAMGRFYFSLLASLAELERAQIAERTKEAMRYKRNRGEYLGGKTPYGFEVEQKVGRGVLVPVEKELAVVQRIKRLRSQGYRGKPMSYKAIARLLLRDGVPTKNGADWHASTIRYICENSLYSDLSAGES